MWALVAFHVVANLGKLVFVGFLQNQKNASSRSRYKSISVVTIPHTAQVAATVCGALADDIIRYIPATFFVAFFWSRGIPWGGCTFVYTHLYALSFFSGARLLPYISGPRPQTSGRGCLFGSYQGPAKLYAAQKKEVPFFGMFG